MYHLKQFFYIGTYYISIVLPRKLKVVCAKKTDNKQITLADVHGGRMEQWCCRGGGWEGRRLR